MSWTIISRGYTAPYADSFPDSATPSPKGDASLGEVFKGPGNRPGQIVLEDLISFKPPFVLKTNGEVARSGAEYSTIVGANWNGGIIDAGHIEVILILMFYTFKEAVG